MSVNSFFLLSLCLNQSLKNSMWIEIHIRLFYLPVLLLNIIFQVLAELQLYKTTIRNI